MKNKLTQQEVDHLIGLMVKEYGTEYTDFMEIEQEEEKENKIEGE